MEDEDAQIQPPEKRFVLFRKPFHRSECLLGDGTVDVFIIRPVGNLGGDRSNPVHLTFDDFLFALIFSLSDLLPQLWRKQFVGSVQLGPG